MKRIVETKFNRVSNYKTANTRLISYYLDDLARRCDKPDKLPSYYLFCLIILNDAILIIKNIVCFYCEFDFKTRIMLYDYSYFIGGIPKYNQIYLSLAFYLAIVISFKFHISRDSSIKDFTLLLDLIRGRKRFVRLLLDSENVLIIKKVTQAADIIYHVMNFMIVCVCKYQILLSNNLCLEGSKKE